MIEPRSGVWWTDGDPSLRVPGALVRVDDGWQLDLIGNLPVNHQWRDAFSLVPSTTVYGACLGTRYTLRRAYLTESKGPSMHFDVPLDERDQADDQHWQRWNGETLLEGDALPESALFGGALFELTGLSLWWPHTGWLVGKNPVRSDQDYEYPNPSIADCGEGLVVTILASRSGSTGIRARSVTERVVVHVVSENGFTLDALEEQVILPLRGLLAISLKKPVEYFNCQLQPLDMDRRPNYPIHVDPQVIDDVAESNTSNDWPTFTVKDIDIAEFLPAWLKLARNNPVPVAVAEPRIRSGTLESDVVEVVNAAEALHRTLTTDTTGFALAEQVKEVLKDDGRLNSRERKKVYSAVKLTELTLEKRLLQLAQGLGEDFCQWFFADRVAEWALVAAKVRNALSHGYPTSHLVEHDTGALYGVLRITQAVIQLRLLCEAGLPSGYPLADLLMKDRASVALMNQTVADWPELAARIGASA